MRKHVKLLDYEFFTPVLKKDELDLLKKEFSEVYKINDGEACIICFDNFYDTLVTTLPTCKHKYHFECLKLWTNQKNICPQDREYVRKLMVRHYHKGVKLLDDDSDY